MTPERLGEIYKMADGLGTYTPPMGAIPSATVRELLDYIWELRREVAWASIARPLPWRQGMTIELCDDGRWHRHNDGAVVQPVAVEAGNPPQTWGEMWTSIRGGDGGNHAPLRARWRVRGGWVENMPDVDSKILPEVPL